MTQKTASKLILSCVALFWVLATLACTASEDPDKNKIVVNIPAQQMQSLDPSLWVAQTVLAQGTIFEGLFGYDKELNLVPKVAESYELSPDKLTWKIHLQKDKLWSNGDSLTAHDFVYSWLRYCSPNRPSSGLWASFFSEVVGAQEFKNGAGDPDKLGFKALDNHTIEIKLKRAINIIPRLALASAVPLHQKSIENANSLEKEWWKPGTFVGNGPYVPISFQADGEIVLEKNKHYVGKVGNVDKFVLKSGGLTVQLQNYEAGDLDIAHILSIGDYIYATRTKRLVSHFNEEEELGFHGFQIARTVNPILQDERLRHALALAVDKKFIAEAVMGNRVVPTGVYGPPSDPMLQGVPSYSYNPDSARKILEEIGYNETKPVIYIFAPPGTDARGWAAVTEALQSQWKQVGLNVLIENMEDGLLNQYAWNSGYLKGEQYKRPGVTMYAGKLLWKEPYMFLRLADHTWYYHNYPYELKEKMKALNLEAKEFSNLNKGLLPEDWEELEQMILILDSNQRKVIEEEENLAYRAELGDISYLQNYQEIKSQLQKSTSDSDKKKLWLAARGLIKEGTVRLLQYSSSELNKENNRLTANLRLASLEEATPLIKKLQKSALEQAWIIPLYSEKLVYLKRPWLKNQVLNKFGAHLMMFNLQYMEVDTTLYHAEK